MRDPQSVAPDFDACAIRPRCLNSIVIDRDVARCLNCKLLDRIRLELDSFGGVRSNPVRYVILSDGRRTDKWPANKILVPKRAILLQVVGFTYSQYAFSNSQTCASSLAEVCPKAVAPNARNKVMVRNMCRSYLTNQEGGKVPTQIMVTWRITDKAGTRDTPSKRASLNACAECLYCARNAVIGSTFVARSAGT